MANPSVPTPYFVVAEITDLVNDIGGVGAYVDGGGAEADMAAGVIQAETDIAALEGEAGDYTGGGGAEADIATGLVQAETDITALETELGDYTGGGGAEADIATGLTQAETDITALEARTEVVTVSKAIGFADVAALGAVASGSIDFDAALPAGALVIGAGINVTAIFDNAGDTATVEADVGIASGDTDAFCDGLSLDAVAVVGSPAGVGMGTLVGAVTPSVLVDPDVNCDTITKGACVAYVTYITAY